MTRTMLRLVGHVVGWSLVILASCTSLNVLVPPVDGSVSSVAAQLGIETEAAERGRAVYLSRRCVGCHGPWAVRDLQPASYREVLARMADQASLSKQETDDLIAYIACNVEPATAR